MPCFIRKINANPGLEAPEMKIGEEIMRASKLGLAGASLAAVFSAGIAQAQQPLKIRGSWVAPVANWASILLEKKELAQHLGKSYVFEPVRFAGTPPMVTAMANGELEVCNLAYSTLGIAIQNAGSTTSALSPTSSSDGVEG